MVRIGTRAQVTNGEGDGAALGLRHVEVGPEAQVTNGEGDGAALGLRHVGASDRGWTLSKLEIPREALTPGMRVQVPSSRGSSFFTGESAGAQRWSTVRETAISAVA